LFLHRFYLFCLVPLLTSNFGATEFRCFRTKRKNVWALYDIIFSKRADLWASSVLVTRAIVQDTNKQYIYKGKYAYFRTLNISAFGRNECSVCVELLIRPLIRERRHHIFDLIRATSGFCFGFSEILLTYGMVLRANYVFNKNQMAINNNFGIINMPTMVLYHLFLQLER
jgi:hypothetical protein